MKASIHYSKGAVLVLSFLLAFLMLMPVNKVYAASSYTVTGTETSDELTKVIDGTTVDASGNPYDEIIFPAGTYTFNMTSPVHIRRTVIIKADAGAQVTLNGGDFRGYANSNITFTGTGSFLLMNPNTYGIWSNDASAVFNFDNTNFTIDGAPGFGFYALLGGNTTNIKGGTFTIRNCSQNGNEGGLELDGGALNISDGAQVTFENNGNGTFGDMYMNGQMTVSGVNTKLTINESRGGTTGYAMVIPSFGHLTVDGATVEINTTAAPRGINAAGNANEVIKLINGAKLNVKASSGVARSGIRRAKIVVDQNSSLNVEGYAYALDGSILVANDVAHVTLKGTTSDNGSAVGFTGGTNGSVITGGSVLQNPATHVVNGVEEAVPTGSAVSTKAINTAGEELTRFDIAGFANGAISIAADPNDSSHPSYTYFVGENHNGVAYVWAPAVKINFWENKNALDNNDANKIVKALTTIRGNTVGLVNGVLPSAPPAPTGKVFSHWIDSETGQKYDENTALTKPITNVYPEYKDAPVNPPAKPPVKDGNKVKPNTGDNSPMALYVVILTSTMLAFTLGIRLRRKS